MSIAGRQQFKTITGEVASAQTLDADTISWTYFKAVAYKIRFNNADNSIIKILELRATKENSSVSDVIYSALGDSIDVDIQVLKSGADVFLRLTNNEAYTVGYTILKTLL